MELVIRGRGEGKTARLMEWLSGGTDKEARVMVSFNYYESGRLMREGVKSGRFESWQFVTFDELLAPGALSGLALSGRSPVLAIDNADIILQRMAHHRIEVMSLTSGCRCGDSRLCPHR